MSEIRIVVCLILGPVFVLVRDGCQPAIDREMLASIMDNFEKVLAEGPNPKKKHLLHRLVKKVLIYDRRTIEIWYGLPNQDSDRTPAHLAPQMSRSTNRQVDPEVWFRIVHLARTSHNDAAVAAYREQTVEIALEPKGAFENGNIGTLRRRVPPDQSLSAVPHGLGEPKPPRVPKFPRVVELLRKAIEWKDLLESGKADSQAEMARREGVTRARVTQVLGMLRLAPEIQNRIVTLPNSVRPSSVTERLIRPITAITDYHDQIREFQKLLG